jgi:hypothetical protein
VKGGAVAAVARWVRQPLLERLLTSIGRSCFKSQTGGQRKKDGQWRGRGIYGFQMHGDLNACAKTKSMRMWKRVETREVRSFNDAYREQRKFDEGGEQI